MLFNLIKQIDEFDEYLFLQIVSLHVFLQSPKYLFSKNLYRLQRFILRVHFVYF